MFICDYCGKEYTRIGDLKQHIKYCKNNPNRIEHHRKNKLPHNAGKHLSEETKQKISNKHKNKHLSEETKQKISNKHKNRPKPVEWIEKYCIGENNPFYGKHHTDVTKNNWSLKRKGKLNPMYGICGENHPFYGKHHDKDFNTKRYDTMKKNHTFKSSKIEEQLIEYFNSNNIEYITQHKSDVYPFSCDFYFPQKDLYVEIQGSWTHGGRPYISEDIECIEQLEKWKAKNTKYYNNAIKTWTERDVKKREIAKANNLNWIEIFSNDLDECLDIIFKILY